MDNTETTKVSIIDVKMPFLSMVIFLVKLSIAAIPAFIIMSIVASILFAIFGTVMHTGMML
ncbi:MAG: hypothetical protein COB26_00935 [Piscirickettsiaceae bacterium]|nr:MAG: hypothetical protein COB26_07955 [Piscirickettsiaceae bacterium]PCI71815.1 MAG: hypothetical protein COB26_00935 [Piscirickettsiaceae bacterium]